MIKDSVAIAYIHQDEVSTSFMRSLTDLLGYDLANGQHVMSGGYIEVRCHGGDSLPSARNSAVEQFLAGESEWMMWFDTDMGFAPDTVDRLLMVADESQRPIVGALCFAFKSVANDGLSGFHNKPIPTLYGWSETEGATGFLSVGTYPINSVIRVAGTGSACILIHRTVFEAVHDKYGSTWYNRVPNASNGGSLISEDLSFCLRAGKLNFPIHVATSVKTNHHKSVWVNETMYWSTCYVPHATQQVDIVVPVLARPQNAKPFMDSLRASTGLAHVFAVCDTGDEETIAAWRTEGASVIRRHETSERPGTFSEKINYALNGVKLKSPWVFICGDDVMFHSGWLDHAQFAAKDLYDVIGTNDMANPRVMAGDHATHLLIRRSYIVSRGGTFDGTRGKLCHEGYKHNFVDDEIVMVAKHDQLWTMALGSLVEHRHPIWNTAKPDATYELGASTFNEDYELFQERVSKYASDWPGFPER